MLDSDIWRLSEAVPLIQKLQPHIRTLGFHICLGGGVLNKGESQKDLDLFVLPVQKANEPKPEAKLATDFFDNLWGKGTPLLHPRAPEPGTLERVAVPQWQAIEPMRLNEAILNLNELLGAPRRPLIEQQVVETDYPVGQHPVYRATAKYSYSGLRVDVFVL